MKFQVLIDFDKFSFYKIKAQIINVDRMEVQLSYVNSPYKNCNLYRIKQKKKI